MICCGRHPKSDRFLGWDVAHNKIKLQRGRGLFNFHFYGHTMGVKERYYDRSGIMVAS